MSRLGLLRRSHKPKSTGSNPVRATSIMSSLRHQPEERRELRLLTPAQVWAMVERQADELLRGVDFTAKRGCISFTDENGPQKKSPG